MSPISLAISFGVGFIFGAGRRSQPTEIQNMNKELLLKLLALIAAMQAVQADDRAAIANVRNAIAQVKDDEDLSDDPEVEKALEAVLRAAETAPPNSDAIVAAKVTSEAIGKPPLVGTTGPVNTGPFVSGVDVPGGQVLPGVTTPPAGQPSTGTPPAGNTFFGAPTSRPGRSSRGLRRCSGCARCPRCPRGSVRRGRSIRGSNSGLGGSSAGESVNPEFGLGMA